MATTGYSSTGAYLDTAYGRVRIHGDIVYNASRTNNTVTFSGTYARIKYVRETGTVTSFYYGAGWTWKLYIGTGTLRRTNTASGTRNINDVSNGTSNTFSVSVSSSATTYTGIVGAYFSGDGQTNTSTKTMSIPALGSPAGTTSMDSGTTQEAQLGVRNNVTSWGANATSGSVRSYIANNSSFTGQTYIGTSDNALVTHTGLNPNTKYWLRGWASNGGGKTAYMNTVTGVTWATSTINTTDIQATEINLTGTATTGEYTPTTKLQYKLSSDESWTDGTSTAGGTFDVSATGLLPSTSYDYRVVTTTTAGTWTGDTITVDTLPAAKLVMPNGDVVNAIPHVITPDGSEEMVKVRIIE